MSPAPRDPRVTVCGSQPPAPRLWPQRHPPPAAQRVLVRALSADVGVEGTATIPVPAGQCWAGSAPPCHIRHAVCALRPRWFAEADSCLSTAYRNTGRRSHMCRRFMMFDDDTTRWFVYTEYTTHTGSTIFACPPGTARGGYVGETLLAAM